MSEYMCPHEIWTSASKLSEIIEKIDQSEPILRKAYVILRPILNDALAGKVKEYTGLPHRSFFFGMYEDSLPAHYLNDSKFMNALSDFDLALRHEEL